MLSVCLLSASQLLSASLRFAQRVWLTLTLHNRKDSPRSVRLPADGNAAGILFEGRPSLVYHALLSLLFVTGKSHVLQVSWLSTAITSSAECRRQYEFEKYIKRSTDSAAIVFESKRIELKCTPVLNLGWVELQLKSGKIEKSTFPKKSKSRNLEISFRQRCSSQTPKVLVIIHIMMAYSRVLLPIWLHLEMRTKSASMYSRVSVCILVCYDLSHGKTKRRWLHQKSDT